MKIPKEVKKELEKIPHVMVDFARTADNLAKDCREIAGNLAAHISVLEVEDE